MKIVVIAGGLSPERDVSLSSSSLIANALIDSGYQVCLADLYIGIENDNFEGVFKDSASGKRYSYSVPPEEPDLESLKREFGDGDSLIGKNIIALCKYADLVFLGLHGGIGEDGRLQAVFDSFGIRYTGTGYLGSALAMDKDLAKKLMLQNQILTPPWIRYNGEDGLPMRPPFAMKPCGCGSSIGVSIVKSAGEYAAAFEYAKKYEDKIILEKMIEGREFSVGVLDGEALPPIEIVPREGFYDYKNKYQPGAVEEICPADLPGDIAESMKGTALRVHNTLGLGSYSRIDFILDANNSLFCLEANTLPGMTPTSLLPQEARAVGISYNELCDRIVRLALRGQ